MQIPIVIESLPGNRFRATSNYSYGFTERRNAHQAVLQGQQNLNEGDEWIIELDLEKFFD